MTLSWFLSLLLLSFGALKVRSSSSTGLIISSEFTGESYISYDLRENSISTKSNDLSLEFKTFHPSGLLVYSSGTQGDFITLELIQGKLRFAIDLGSTSSIAGRHEVIIGDSLADNRWHVFKMTRRRANLIVKLDSIEKSSTTPGSFISLDLDKFIYIGGLNRKLSSDFHGSRDTPNFIGCLKDVYFDFIDILYGAYYNMEKYKSPGGLKYSCPRDNYHPVGFPSSQSHLRFSDPSHNNLTFSLSFRSYTKNGIIAFRMSQSARVYVGLVGGALELEVRIGIDPPIQINVGKNLDDGMWHDISSGVDLNEMWVSLDDKPEVRHSNPRLKGLGVFQNVVLIGSGTQRTGFIGCMHGIRVNGVPIQPKRMSKSNLIEVDVDQCKIKSICFPNPCQNGGRCKQYTEQYACDCTGTFYHGNHCEIPLYQATCADYKALGVSQDSYCTVDADGEGPLGGFEVLCNVSGSNTAATIITHDKMKKQLVPEGASPHNGFYFHYIRYHQADMASIRAVINKSTRCRQYISFNCFESKILSAPVGPATAYWISASGTLHNYWGGAPKNRQSCACGITGTCDNPLKLCNCDIGDAKWREDAGYLTDKSALPVTVLQFTDEAAKSKFTLGPLECFGTKERSVYQSSIVQSACRLVNPPPPDPTPSQPGFVPTAWVSGEGKNLTPWPTTPERTDVNPTVRPADQGGQVTVTTTISTHDNRTHVTSTVKHNVKNGSKTTIQSSISSDKTGVTVHSSISSKDKGVMQPTVDPSVDPPTEITYKWRNGSVAHVTRVTAYEYSEKFIILVVASVAALILLIVVVIVLLLRRSGRTYVSCVMCKRCRNKRSIPDIEIYRHSMNCDSPDVLQLDDMRPTSMELGAYNARSGKAVYHSVHQGGSVKKFVSFSSSTSKI